MLMIYSGKQLNEQKYFPVAKNYYAMQSERKDLKYGKGHIALCECVADRRSSIVFTAQSACAYHGIERINDYEMRPHAITQSSRRAEIVRWHLGPPDKKEQIIRGRHVAGPIRAICDLYGSDTPDSILSAINSCLFQNLFTKKQLSAELQRLPKMRGRSCLERLVQFATPKCESPLETLGLIAIYNGQFVMPQQQVEIYEGYKVIFRVDMYWELPGRKIVLELDGRIKYRCEGRDEDDKDKYYKEKMRQDYLINNGYEIIRASWNQIKRGYLPEILNARGIPRRRNMGLLFPGYKK
jgi:very-short-patch-repair endonuclease